MVKTQGKLNALKTEYKTSTAKRNELSDEELGYVAGGGSDGPKTYYFGDVYKSSASVVYVVTDEANTSGAVNCDYYSYVENYANDLGTYVGKTSVNRLFFKNYTFIFHIDNYVER